jgi:sugar phosphate isomerase/epimerase
MKLSCLPVSFFRAIITGAMSLGEWARTAHEVGLDAIDVSMLLIKAHTPSYLKGIRREIESENMSLTMVTTYPDFSHPAAQQRGRELEYLRSDIAVASQLGAKYLRVTAGQAHPQTPLKEGIGWVVENLKYACEICERYDLKLVYENHMKTEAWEYLDFSHPTGVFLEIVEKTESIDLGINFDTANTVAYGDDPIPLLRSILHRIETVHAAETATVGSLTPTLLGTGLVPFQEIFSLLKKSGFDGWICMEEASNSGFRGVRMAAEFVRKTWNRCLIAD